MGAEGCGACNETGVSAGALCRACYGAPPLPHVEQVGARVRIGAWLGSPQDAEGFARLVTMMAGRAVAERLRPQS